MSTPVLWWQIFSGVWSVFKIAEADDYCETFLPVIEIHFIYYNIDNSGNKYLGWDMMGAAIFGVVQNLANSLGCILSEIFALPRRGGRERPNFGFPQILNCISWCRPNSHSQLARHLPSFLSVKYEHIMLDLWTRTCWWMKFVEVKVSKILACSKIKLVAFLAEEKSWDQFFFEVYYA